MHDGVAGLHRDHGGQGAAEDDLAPRRPIAPTVVRAGSLETRGVIIGQPDGPVSGIGRHGEDVVVFVRLRLRAGEKQVELVLPPLRVIERRHIDLMCTAGRRVGGPRTGGRGPGRDQRLRLDHAERRWEHGVVCRGCGGTGIGTGWREEQQQRVGSQCAHGSSVCTKDIVADHSDLLWRFGWRRTQVCWACPHAACLRVGHCQSRTRVRHHLCPGKGMPTRFVRTA